MKKRPQADNVIYANFGAKRRSSGPDDVLILGDDPAQARSQKSTSNVSTAPTRASQSVIEPVSVGSWLRTLLEEHADLGRIRRGRDYARNGAVTSLKTRNGRLTAQVQGSQIEPFNVHISLAQRSSEQLSQALDLLVSGVGGFSSLRDGLLTPDVLGILLSHDISELHLVCDCPDPEYICKHCLAAVVQLESLLDMDPTAVLQLRGLDYATLQESFAGSAENLSRQAMLDPEYFYTGRNLPQLPSPKAAPAINDSDLSLLHKALRMISYTSVDELRGVSDVEDMYDMLCRSSVIDNEP